MPPKAFIRALLVMVGPQLGSGPFSDNTVRRLLWPQAHAVERPPDLAPRFVHPVYHPACPPHLCDPARGF